MSWLDAMKRDAVALVDPDLVLTKDMTVAVDMYYDDGYDPTFGDRNPSYSFEVTVFDTAGDRYLVSVSYANQEAQEFWVDLMKAGSE